MGFNTIRIVRTFAFFFLFFITSYRLSAHRTFTTQNAATTDGTRNAASTANEHFILCNKKIYLETLPSSENEGTRYGVYRWNRDLNNAIVLEHRTGGTLLYGRTGNQIQEFFKAFDMARDRGGALVIHKDGFPLDFTLRKVFLGLGRKGMESRLGVMFDDRIAAKYRSNLEVVLQHEAYHYVSSHPNFTIFDAMEHRHYIIQQLYLMTAWEMQAHPNSPGAAAMCISLHAIFGKDGHGGNAVALEKLGITKAMTQKYTVIHSRKLESLGKMFLSKASEEFGVDNRAGIELPPDLITSILTPLGMNNNSILMITDGQSSDVIQRLSSDPAIGPFFQVVPPKISTLTGDLMLAILSDVFIGNPVSTFSQYIVQARYALGIGNSYLFAKRNVKTEKWETFCNDEECFYHWLNLWAPLI